MKQKSVFTGLVIFEILIIVFLAFNYIKREKILHETTVHPLNKADFQFTISNDLKHFYEPKPNVSLKNKPDWLDYESTNTINSDSLNERYDYTTEKPPATYRIITLGDSMTFGLYLDTNDNFSERLEDMLNSNLQCKNIKKFEVINLGVGGYDARYVLERYILRGQKYNPDLVAWFLLDRSLSVYADMFYDVLDYYDNLANYSPNPEQLAFRAQREEYNQKNIGEIENYEINALTSIRKYFNNKLLFFTSPGLLSSENVNKIKGLTGASQNTFFDDKIGNLTDDNNIVRPGDPHPNAAGSKIIAQDLYNYLTQNLIDCKK
ncbi:MAG: SGNH/GDSL hydrolase family protein [Candidatus Doudnabacteria bacterium]